MCSTALCSDDDMVGPIFLRLLQTVRDLCIMACMLCVAIATDILSLPYLGKTEQCMTSTWSAWTQLW